MVSSGLVNRVDVSHFRLSLHLVIAFLILSMILWNYFKLNIKTNDSNKINIFFPLVSFNINIFSDNSWRLCIWHGCWFDL